jgi:phosphoglycerate dehydrogenase-like enzyme
MLPEVRCLVIGRSPTPDPAVLARLDQGVELVGPGAGVGEGSFDCIWRLFGGHLEGAQDDPLEAGLKAHPEVRWVHTVSAGIDHLRPLLERHPGVSLTTSAGVVAVPIAEFVMACLLHHCKRLAHLDELQRQRRFESVLLRELGDLRVVLVGLGAIGNEVARRALALGAQLVAVRGRPELGGGPHGLPVVGPDGLTEACRGADALVLAAPLTGSSRGMVGEVELRLMAEGSALVNVARGGLVDEPALLRALAGGPLSAAYLDAFEEEPLPASSPLWTAPGAFLSPHVSWSSPHFAERSTELFLDQLTRFREGLPLRNVADLARGY